MIVIGPNEKENPLSSFDIYMGHPGAPRAITLHEAAHGLVAHLFGDDTALRQGRVSFNPLKHVDPFGTILLPALLLLSRAPFLFGYAKPVPVSFQSLQLPRLASFNRDYKVTKKRLCEASAHGAIIARVRARM